MWVAKFKLKDDDDLYSPLCQKYNIQFHAYSYTNYTKENKIHLMLGGTLFGEEKNKEKFVASLKKQSCVAHLEQHFDFIFVHVVLPYSREIEAEICVFYNPQYIRVKPTHISSDGWEYWEIACVDREELNKIVQAAIKHYHGKLQSLKQEKLRSVTSLELIPILPQKQQEALQLAYKEGYYNYPRKRTLPQLAKLIHKSYSAFHENLRKAESKLIEHFLKHKG